MADVGARVVHGGLCSLRDQALRVCMDHMDCVALGHLGVSITADPWGWGHDPLQFL